MISIFPGITETLVLPLSAGEVEQRVRRGLDGSKFAGTVGDGRFRLAPYLIRPPQFQPLLKGRIEATTRGCVVFLRYELYPATRLLIVCVLVILLLCAVVSVVAGAHILYTVLAIAMMFVIRGVAVVNIRLHRDPVRKNLLDILSD